MPVEQVQLDDGGSIPYDTLILATGARHAYFGHDEWEPFAPGLKTLEDATTLRRRILVAFERAERETDPDARAALLTLRSGASMRPASCADPPRTTAQ